MSFVYEEKQSRSRSLDIIWRTHDTSDGTYLAAADACRDMIFIRSAHGNRVLLSGPSSKITPVPYRAGNRNFGIRFHRGSFLTDVPITTMVDTTEALPMPTPESFLLAGSEWLMPTYETADDFVAELERRELLSDDPLVNAALRGEEPAASLRSVQRHVSHVTGLTTWRGVAEPATTVDGRPRAVIEGRPPAHPVDPAPFSPGLSKRGHSRRARHRRDGLDTRVGRSVAPTSVPPTDLTPPRRPASPRSPRPCEPQTQRGPRPSRAGGR